MLIIYVSNLGFNYLNIKARPGLNLTLIFIIYNLDSNWTTKFWAAPL